MRFAVKTASLIAFALSVVWLIYKPGFDSAVAAAAALAALLPSFLLKEDEKSGKLTQHVSGKSIGIQAGRDVKADNFKSK